MEKTEYYCYAIKMRIYPSQEQKDLLASSYTSCLACAHEHKLRSLALCCVSTGVFNFPPQLAASIAVQTVQNFLRISMNRLFAR